MKDQLINDLEGLFNELVDYRSRLLHHLNDASVTEQMSGDAIEDLQQIRMSLSYTEDHIIELKEQINKRVYCVEVTTEVEQVIKVLAKNEDDAIREAIETVDNRIEHTLSAKYDIYYHSDACSHGDESPEDDVADIEVHYDE
jgi:hypothetical protein